MDEVNEERVRRKEISKAANRLKMLEKLEEYREQKMQKEIEQLEAERKLEEQELQKARDKEKKYNKYLEKQREKLAEHNREKVIEDDKRKRQEAEQKKKEARERQKKQKEHEQKKRAIEAYKEKKRNAEELLANADLDDLDSDGDDYQEFKQSPRKADAYDDVEASEDDASRYLNKMIELYKGKGDDSDNTAGQQRKARPPPAVM